MNLWPQHSVEFLQMLHGESPWPFVSNSGCQRLRMSSRPDGMNFLFVHRCRGNHDLPGFTSLNLDLPTGQEADLPHPPTAVFTMRDRTAFMWILQERMWPCAEFYETHQRLTDKFGVHPDRAGLARLLPVPGNPEFPCAMTEFRPVKYRLSQFW